MRLFFLIVFILLFFNSKSQYVELGATAGTSYYIGEINPFWQILYVAEPAGGLFLRHILNDRYALRYSGLYGKLSGHDNSVPYDFNKFRDLAFKATIIEVSGIVEFNYFPFNLKDDDSYWYSPYLFTGLSAFYYSSTLFTSKNNNIGDIAPKSSSFAIAPAFLFGMGMKYKIAKRIEWGFELGMRKTFTDNLDALPNRTNKYQTGFEKNKDWYAYGGLLLSFRINNRPEKCPAYQYK